MNSIDYSAFQSSSFSLDQKLEKARAELLDLGARNRLLNIPRSNNSRFLDVIDERSDQIYKLFVQDKKVFTFLHGKASKGEEDEFDDELNDENEYIYHFDEKNNDEILNLYDAYAKEAKELMEKKNHDYGEAWREMRISSITDLIYQKVLRTKQIEDNQGKTEVSEGIDANYFDMLNYAVFCLIKLNE